MPTSMGRYRLPLSCLLLLTPLAGCEDSSGRVERDIGLPDFRTVDAFADTTCIREPEVCDGEDNNCNGLVDEDDPELLPRLFDDLENCGACGRVCAAENAAVGCRAGRCYITGCTPGFNDQNGDFTDGCESDCIISAGGREQCDGEDNDCDGAVDEGFDTDTDLSHCGGCDVVCDAPANGAPVCVGGQCGLGPCDAGYIDLDGDPANGCEYGCVPNGVDEFCNGIDDDCDGTIDEVADMALPENFCGEIGACEPECDGEGGCAGGERCNAGACVLMAGGPEGDLCETDDDCRADHPGYACVARSEPGPDGPLSVRRCTPRRHAPVCDGDRGFRCLRRPLWQGGDELGLCDDADNDCDGRVDEDYVDQLFEDGANRSIPRTCQAGEGICLRTETYRCADDGDGTICPVRPAAPEALDDDCNARDDDCDGLVDEAFVDAWVDMGGFQIYAFEAVRPGATAEVPGLDVNPDDGVAAYIESRACSRPGALPWANVTWADAEAACANAGARLCTAAEWQRACAGAGGGRAYPYGVDYDALACNGGENDVDPASPGLQDGPLIGGALATCETEGVYDLSGNLKEWIDEADADLRAVRGGGFETNVAAGLTCVQDSDLKPAIFRASSIGFRCCR